MAVVSEIVYVLYIVGRQNRIKILNLGGKKPSKGVSYGETTSLIYFLVSSYLSYHLIGKELRVKKMKKS